MMRLKWFFHILIILIGMAVPAGSCAAAPAEPRAMIPYSGEHALIQHKFDKGYKAGRADGLAFSDRGLGATHLPSAAGLIGNYVSEEIPLKFPARQLVLTWNADMSAGAWLHVQFRVRGADADWSGWYDMAEWRRAEQEERNTRDESYGKLKVDILDASRNFNRVQYRIGFFTDVSGSGPNLRMVSLCYSQPEQDPDHKVSVKAPAGAKDVILPVPWVSQIRLEDVEDPAMIEAGVCAPTSTTMVMQFLGKPVRVKQIASYAFDPVSELYGNWAYLAATAGDYGLHAWVQRFNTWEEVRRLVEQGTPVIISIAYPPGTFKDDPEKTSDGHLMVVRGFTAGGNVIVNDPGTAHRDRGQSMEYHWEEMAVAFFGHGGVGIVISK